MKRTSKGKAGADPKDRNKARASVDEMAEESFPASDPPSYSGGTAGAPQHKTRPASPPARRASTARRDASRKG